MAVLSKQKQPDGQTSRFQRQLAFSLRSRTINLSAAGPSRSQQKQAQWPFYQREAQWPFYQSRSNRMARPPDFNDKLHFCYYPARSVYQRPGQAIVSKSRPNGSLINARPNSRFIKAEATGWPDLRQIAFSLFSRTINLSAAGPSYSQQKQAQWPFYPREAHWPFYQSRSNRTARAPGFNDKLHFCYYPARSIYQRPGQFSAKASPTAVLSKQKQPDGQTSRFQRQIAFSLLSRTISLSAKQAQWPFYQREAQWPFYQEQRPGSQTPDLSRGLQNSILSRASSLSAAGPSYSQQKQAQSMAVLSKQKQPDGQTSKFQRQIAFSLLSRTINLSAAGPS